MEPNTLQLNKVAVLEPLFVLLGLIVILQKPWRSYLEFIGTRYNSDTTMKQVPDTEHVLVLRTNFSDQSAWEELREEIQKPVGILRFRAFVEFLDDPEYADITKDQLLKLLPSNYNHSFIIVADGTTISQSEHPLLIIDLFDESTRDFRAIPSQIQGIENNLSIANMDFEDFADAVDVDGVFRGFPGDPYNP